MTDMLLNIFLNVGGFIFLIITWILILDKDYEVAIITAIAAVVLFGTNVARISYDHFHEKPEKVLEQKVQNFQKAERELQKFLIDHPELKEN